MIDAGLDGGSQWELNDSDAPSPAILQIPETATTDKKAKEERNRYSGVQRGSGLTYSQAAESKRRTLLIQLRAEQPYRICRRCGDTFSPTDRDLIKNQYRCRGCAKAETKARDARLPSRSGSKTWAPEKRDAFKATYKLRPGVKERIAALARERARDPQERAKNECRRKTRQAIADGRLRRGACERCANPKTDAHHDDYTKPLDVQWLCRACHSALHRAAKARGEEPKAGKGRA